MADSAHAWWLKTLALADRAVADDSADDGNTSSTTEDE
ncbi:hypothetical protein HD593_011004 [Nonomuraea rubra]|uniref:Uncharacterized protein n=1 Tax=Nonomuraea rubra TaxID=46180 RepID=A0A7X0P6K6_9ACTN|nr:hypothetical protein [Nonomuraea rubra]